MDEEKKMYFMKEDGAYIYCMDENSITSMKQIRIMLEMGYRPMEFTKERYDRMRSRGFVGNWPIPIS